MTKFFKDFFEFSTKESRQAIILLCIMMALIGFSFADFLFPSKQLTSIKIEQVVFEDDAQNSTSFEKNYNNNYQNKSNDNFEQNSQVAVSKKFNFDPNVASVNDFQKLGLPKFMAERIDKYKSKGGKFRFKEDLSKIYGLEISDYELLEPFITLPSKEDKPSLAEKIVDNQLVAKNFDKKIAFTPIEKPKFEKKNPSKFDINTADTSAFKQLKGLGSGYAKQIIKFRESLGGFHSVDQIADTWGLPPEVYEEIKTYGYFNKPPRKRKINEATIEDLDHHPFIALFQAKTIVAYREQHGKFSYIQDLAKIKTLKTEFISKIEPYLEF